MGIEAGLGGGTYGALVTANTTANTKGSWTELLASTSEEAVGIYVDISSATASGRYLLDIGTGAAAAESAVIANIPFAAGSSAVVNVSLPGFYVPLSIASGTRISARCQSSTAGGVQLQVSIYVVGGSGSATVTTYGADTSDSGGTEVDPGASANTKGAYSEIASATSADHDTFIAIVTGKANAVPTTAAFVMDIATGAAASESIVIPNLAFSSNDSADSVGPIVFSFPLSISSGTRLAARAAATTNDATDRLFDVIVLGVSNGQPSGGGGASAYAFIG